MCRRSIYFMAIDLVTFIDPNHPLHIPVFRCEKCKTAEFVSMTTHYPQAGDYGRLPVRRLDKVIQVRKWRNAKLGE